MTAAPVQLTLPGCGAPPPRPPRRRNRGDCRAPAASHTEDRLLASYLRRLGARGAAPKGFAAYRYQLRTLLRVARRIAGHPIGHGALFRDAALLGRALVDDRDPDSGRQLSKWTLAQRRSAARSFVSLMQPELQALLGESPHAVLDRALRSVAQRVGAGYRLTGGAPRKRGGYAPAPDEVASVIAAAGRMPGFAGLRNAVFFAILAETGTRVNALRELDGADCIAMPSGRLHLFLYAKGKGEAREVELSRIASESLCEYARTFNRQSAVMGWRVRIRPGTAGPVWRSGPRGRWSYSSIVATLRAACSSAGVHEFGPHALRRAFATNAASTLPRHAVALAGGWQGLERLDDHYIQIQDAQMRVKLERAHISAMPQEDSGNVNHPAIVALPEFIARTSEAVPTR